MLKTITAILICLCFIKIIEAQTTNLETKPKAVIVPEDIYLTIKLPQPDCPLQLENILIVKYLDKREDEIFQVRNVGQKPIMSFTFVSLTGTNLEGRYSKKPENLIMPNNAVPFPDTKLIDFVALTDELRNELKLRGPMKDAIIFMILKVKFVDGSEYDDTAKYDMIRDHIRQLRLLEKAEDQNFHAEQSLRSLKVYIESIQ